MSAATTSRHPKPSQASARLREARLHAVHTRNRAYDGTFYYGVLTTGVYCVPSCPSRRARPENIVLFDTAAAAAGAGFRPCRRCHPQRTRSTTPAAQAMRSLCDFIASHAGESLTLARLARISGYSPAYLQRTFQAEVGVSPREFQAALRLAALKGSLRSGSRVADAAFAAGFGSTSRAYAQIDGRLGMTPSAYRAGGAGETIAYACRDTALGPLLMAATDRGVCFAQFGTSQAVLARALAEEFPSAVLVQSDAQHGAALDDWIALLDEHLAGDAPRPDLPLDVRGTAFQVRVWNCLMSLADGEVLSYGELAARLHAPTAVRAVASACARNRIAVLIPCHRVLRSDGSLGGYRWGLERKRALIDAERQRSRSAAEA